MERRGRCAGGLRGQERRLRVQGAPASCDAPCIGFYARLDLCLHTFQVLTANSSSATNAPATGSASGSVGLAFLAQVARGRKAQRVTALRFLHVGSSGGSDGAVETAARPRVVCGSEAGHVQIWCVNMREVAPRAQTRSILELTDANVENTGTLARARWSSSTGSTRPRSPPWRPLRVAR